MKLFEFIRILDADYSVFEIPLFVVELLSVIYHKDQSLDSCYSVIPRTLGGAIDKLKEMKYANDAVMYASEKTTNDIAKNINNHLNNLMEGPS